MNAEVIEIVAKAINAAVYGEKAETRWAHSTEVRDARRKEASAAIAAYNRAIAQS